MKSKHNKTAEDHDVGANLQGIAKPIHWSILMSLTHHLWQEKILALFCLIIPTFGVIDICKKERY